MMRRPIVIAREFRKAGLFGLFVWLALASALASSRAQQPSLLEQLKQGFPAPTPPGAPRKSLGPPVRIEVQTAEVSLGRDTNEPVVVITMVPKSGQMFQELTLKNIGRTLVLRIDGTVAAEPMIKEAIKGGVVQISGNMTLQDAAELAKRLSKGEAKIEVELVE